MPTRSRRELLLCSLLLLPACTGLAAGPAVQTSAAVPVARDSAWARARRGFSAEVMTIDLADSLGGTLRGRRYPKSSALESAPEQCQVAVNLTFATAGDATGLSWDSRWIAPKELAASKADFCERERAQLIERIQQTILPPQ